MNTDGGGAVDTTQASIYDADPAWSPDGAHIVFTRDAGGQTFNLWTARADGTAKLRVTDAPGAQRNSFPDWGSRAAETIATLEPVADTFVRASDPDTPHGAETTFDVHAGASLYCGQGPGPAYGLLRFDLSSLPAGVQVTDARLDLTVVGGFAQDGDGNHYAIRLDSNAWDEDRSRGPDRPEDGMDPGPVGPPFGEATINGVPLSASQDVLGTTSTFNNNCNANSGGPPVRTFTAPQDRAQNFANAVGEVIGTGQLSAQIWSQPCGTATTVPCQSGGSEKAYFLRYYSREAAPALRPKLVVTYPSSVDVTSFNATPVDPKAGIARTAMRRARIGAARAFEHHALRRSSRRRPRRNAARRNPTRRNPARRNPLGETPLGRDEPRPRRPLRGPPDGAPVVAAAPPRGRLACVTRAHLARHRAAPERQPRRRFALTPRPAVLDGQGTTTSRWPTSTTRGAPSATWSRSRSRSAAASRSPISRAPSRTASSILSSELVHDHEHALLADKRPLARPEGRAARRNTLGETPLGETLLWDTPLGETPLGETPLGETPLGETPLGETPLGETALAGTPLGETPLGETDLSRAPLGETPLGETPLGETDLTDAPLGETPLGETPLGETPLGETPLGETLISDIETQSCTTIFVSCPPGTDTIDQHFGELQPNVTIADLVAVLTPAARASLTLGDLVASLANPNGSASHSCWPCSTRPPPTPSRRSRRSSPRPAASRSPTSSQASRTRTHSRSTTSSSRC